MTSEQNVPVTRKRIKANAREILSSKGVQLKLIFCGFFYIAVLVLFELFSSYLFDAMTYNVTDEIKCQNYSLLFTAVSKVPNLLLIFPLFMGVVRVAAKLSNDNPTEIVEIFEYYGSFKKLGKAWAVGAIIQLPITVISLIQAILPFISTNEFYLKTIIPALNFGLNTLYFFSLIFILGRLFPFINSVVCGGDQPVSLCLKASLKSTKGKMWKLFAFYLSFIPWILLSALTVGVLFIIFTFPYMLIAECIYSKYLLTGEYRDHIKEETL